MTDLRFTIEREGDTTIATCQQCGEQTTGADTNALITYLTDDHDCPPLNEPIPNPKPQTRIANPTDNDDNGSTGNPGTTITRHRPTGMGRGRTPNWTDPRLLDAIVDAVAGGCYMRTAAAAAGVSSGAFFRWLAEADKPGAPVELVDFRERVYRARAMAEGTAVEFLWDVARGGHLTKRSTRHDPTGDGYVVEEAFTPPDARPVQFLLERSFPQRWSRRSQLDVAVNPDGPSVTRANDDDDERLDALAERTAAALATIRGSVVEVDSGA